jgi:hypothetical protein
MQHEVFLKDQMIERSAFEKTDRHKQLASKKAHYKNKVAHLDDDHTSQKEIQTTRQSIFAAKNENLEKRLKEAKDEIARLKGEHDNLIVKLKAAVTEAVTSRC